jgi:hypothetical protein
MKRLLVKKRYLWLLIVIIFFPLTINAVIDSFTAADLGTRFEYLPIVRHQISQRHCYDTGNSHCETPDRNKPAFAKEFTLGFLFDGLGPRNNQFFSPIYACLARGLKDTAKYDIVVDSAELNARRYCSTLDLRAKRLGYIANDEIVEAPVALYRCYSNDRIDVLLTVGSDECSIAGYTSPELLGYLMAGGSSSK